MTVDISAGRDGLRLYCRKCGCRLIERSGVRDRVFNHPVTKREKGGWFSTANPGCEHDGTSWEPPTFELRNAY
jgi:hypothetical protein